jgi:hypothetical protein
VCIFFFDEGFCSEPFLFCGVSVGGSFSGVDLDYFRHEMRVDI